MEESSKMARAGSAPLCINDALPQHLLTEIFLRIASTDLFRCKAVCKLWLCLIEKDPDFIGCFILRRIREQRSDEEARPVLRVDWNSYEMVMFTPTFYCDKAPQFFLDFLPIFGVWDPHSKSLMDVVIGSSSGLLLCTNGCSYVICNPITRKWHELPPIPRSHKGRRARAQVGFISDPLYHIDEDSQSVTFNNQRTVKVVRLHFSLYYADHNHREIDVEMFSSHTRCWTTSRAQLPSRANKTLLMGPTTLDNGRMYWMIPDRYDFLVYDINKNEFLMDPLYLPINALYCDCEDCKMDCEDCKMDDWDYDSDICKGFCKCQGSLWVVLAFGPRLRMYELVDDKWCLKHDVHILDDMQCSSSSMKNLEEWSDPRCVDSITMHPSDPRVVYLVVSNMLLQCNLGSRTLVIMENVDPNEGIYILPVSLPLWPTPLPLLSPPPSADDSAGLL